MGAPDPRNFKVSDATPAGVQNYSGSGSPDPRQFITGQNTESTFNGWNTPFMQKFIKDYQGAMDDGTATDYFAQRRDGIALWDDQSGSNGYKLGDVFHNGDRIGNLYEQYGEATADQILTPLMMSAQEQTNGITVAQKREETNKNIAAAATRQQYDAKVQDQKDAWGDETTALSSTLGGAAGGALLGAGGGAVIGSVVPVVGTAIGAAVGGIGGAIVGGVQGFLNQDELTDMAARGEVQAQMAAEDGNEAAAGAVKLQTWSGLAGKAMSPLSGLTHGIYDVTTGTVGDDTAEFYDVDENGQAQRPGWLTGVDVAASLGDAAIQFASPVGRLGFQAQMTAQIGGKVGTMVTTGGETFNDRTGQFDNVFTDDEGNFNALSAAAGVTDVGIDVVQLGMGSALSKVSAQLAGKGAAAGTETLAGMRFTMNEAGQAIGRRYTLSVLAPSEAVQALGARATALLSRGRSAPGAVTADELFSAARRLTDGSSTLKAALVNGFAEGGEEAVQAVAEPLSHQEDIDPYEVATSFLYGTAMGAGMTAGARFRTKGVREREFAQAQTLHALRTNGEELDRKTWDGMSREAQTQALAAPPAVQEMLKEQANQAAKSMELQATRSVAAIGRVSDAQRQRLVQEQKGLNRNLDGAYLISQAGYDIDDNMVVGSVNTIVDLLERRGAGLEEQVRTEADAGLKSQLESMTLATQNIHALMAGFRDAFYTDGLTGEEQGALVAAMNAVLQVAYEITPSPVQLQRLADARTQLVNLAGQSGYAHIQELLTQTVQAIDTWTSETPRPSGVADAHLAKAVTLTLQRNPADNDGSFQALLPQVHLINSQQRADTFLQVTHGILQAISGDFDGDQVNLKTRIVLDDDAWLRLRTGDNLLGALSDSAVNIMQRDFEAQTIEILSSVLREGSTTEVSNVQAMLDSIDAQARAIVPFATEPGGAVDSLIQSLRAGDANSVQKFLTTLARDYATETQRTGQATATNIYYRLNSMIQRGLQDFQFADASAKAAEDAKKLGTDHALPISPESTVGQIRARSAATWTQRLFLATKGNDLFRKWQTLHYSKYTSTELASQTDQNSTVREMTELYELMSSGSTESAMAALSSKNEISAAVIRQLTALVTAKDAQVPGSGRAALALIANMRVPNLLADNTLGREPITITQWLLRKAVDADEAKNATVLERKPELKAKYARLRSMNPGQAFAEVFAGFQMRELLGLDGDVLGANLTVGQWVAAYINQDEFGRQDDARALKSHASYLAKEGERHNLPILPKDLEGSKAVTAYQSVIDALLQAGNETLAWNPSAKVGKTQRGRVEGTLGDSSRRTSEQFIKAVEQIQRTMSDRKQGFDIKSAAAWERLFDTNPQLGRSFMAMIPDSAVFGSFAVQNNQLFAAKWIFEMLTLPPAEAEMEYFRQTVLSSWNALGAGREDDGRSSRTFSALKDRMHILMYQLADEARRDEGATALYRFEKKLFESTDLDAFMSFVNNEIRQNEAPYTAWNRDIAEIDPMATQGGWQSALEGAAQREAITDFSTTVDKFAQNVADEARREKLDDVTFLRLRRAVADPEAGGQELVKALEKSLDFARDFYAPLGPAARERMLAINLYGILPNGTDKGKVPLGFDALGAYQSKGDTLKFGTPEQVVLASLTAYSADEAGMDPTLLMKDGWSLMDGEGNPILMEQLTPAVFTKLWEKPDNRPLLRAIIHPSVYEHTMEGRLDQRFLTDLTLSSLLSGNAMNDLLFESTQRNRAIYLSYIESIAGNEAVSRYLNAVTVTHTSSRENLIGSLDEAMNLVQRAEQDLAELLQMLAFHSGSLVEVKDDEGNTVTMESIDAIREELKRAVAQAQLTARFGGPVNQALIRQAIDETKTSLFQLLPENPSEAQLAAYNTQVEQREALLQTDTMQQVIAKYGQTKTPDQRFDAFQFVAEHPEIATMAEQASGIRLLQSRIGQVEDATGLPKLTSSQWTEVSKAIITYVLEREATTPITGVAAARIPGKKSEMDLKFFDPNFTYLIDDLLDSDSPLVKAAAKLKDTFARTSGRVSRTDVVNKMLTSIMDPKKLGTWTSEMVSQIQQGNDRIDSAGAAFGISRGGSGPQFETTEGMATRRTFTVPGDELRSTVELDFDDLTGDWTQEVLVTRPGSSTFETMRLGLLDGRFTNEVTVIDRTTGIEYDLHTGSNDPVLPFTDSEANSAYGSITTHRLLTAYDKLASRENLDLENLTVRVRFFHPLDQPATPEFANNLYFEGVALEQGDSFGSLDAAWWFAAGGIDPTASKRALGAAKKRAKALKNAQRFTRDQKVALEAGWSSDFGGMLLRKAYTMLDANLGDGERIQANFLNAVVKKLKMRHFVRFYDAGSDTVVVLSAEEVLDLQKSGGSLPIDAELYIPSDSALRTMLGERGKQGELRVFSNAPDIDPTTITPWEGKVNAQHIENLPGLVGTVDVGDTKALKHGDLFATSAARQGFQRELSYNSGVDRATSNRFQALLLEQEQLAAEVGVARVVADSSRFQENARAAVQFAGSAISTSTSVQQGSNALGIKSTGVDDVLAQQIDAALSNDLQSQLSRHSQTTGYIYHHIKPKNVVDGLDRVGYSSLQNKGKKPDATWIAPGDLISVNLDSFVDAGADAFPQLRRALGRMMDMGANIVLVSPTNSQGDLRTEGGRYLRDSGYRKAPGSNSFFFRANPADTPISRQARFEKLMETEAVETFNQTMMLQTDFGGLQENAAWWMADPKNGQRIAKVSDPVPIQAYEGFGLALPGQVDEVRQRILDGIDDLIELSNSTYSHELKKMSKRERAEAEAKLRRSLEKAANHLNEWGVYDPGARFEVGDIVPLVHQDGRVLLYRHGHTAPDRETFNVMMKDRRMGLYGPQPIPQATTHSGEVIGFEPSNQYGLRVQMGVDLQTLGDKIVLERNGHKLMLVAPPADFALPNSISNRPITVVMSLSDVMSKENYDGRIDNFRNAFAALGVDFTEELAQFFYDTAAPSQAQLDSVPGLLETYRKKVTKVDLETLDRMIKLENIDQVYREALTEIGQGTELEGVDAGWADRLVRGMTPSTRIARGALLYLMAEDAQVEHILRSGGMNSEESLQRNVFTRQMPRLFTQLFDRDRLDGELRTYVLGKLNKQFVNTKGSNGRVNSGMTLLPDFRVRIVTGEKTQRSLDGYLQFAEFHSSGDNPALSLMSQERQQKQIASQQLTSMAALALDSRTSTSRTQDRSDAAISGRGIRNIESGADLLTLVRDIPKEELSTLRHTKTLAEREYAKAMRLLVTSYRQELDTSEWTEDEKSAYVDLRNGVANAYHLSTRDSERVDYWVRQYLGRPHEIEPDEAGYQKDRLSFADAKEILSTMRRNRLQGALPVVGGDVPMLHANDLLALYQGAERAGMEWLRSRTDSDTTVTTWDDWVHVALSFGAQDNETFDSAHLNAVDGMLHGYHSAGVTFAGLPMSFNPFRAEQLMDPATSKLFLSVSPHRRELLREEEILAVQSTLEDIFGGTRVGLAWKSKTPPASAIERGRRRKAFSRKKKGMAVPAGTTAKNLLADGQKFVTDGTVQNALFRTMLNMRAALALLNPLLYVGAPAEGFIQERLERAANLVTGDSTGKVTGRLNGLSSAEVKELGTLYRALGSDQRMKGMVYSEITMKSDLQNAGPIETFTHRLAKVSGKWQDPYWGMRADSVARRYVESAIRFLNSAGTTTNLTPVMVSQRLAANPEWLKQVHPAAHTAAMATLLNIRNVKPTVFSLAWRGFVDPLSENPRLIPQTASTLFLKLPFMFAGYTMNKAVQLLGLQGWDQAAAMFLHGRKNPIFGRMQAVMAGKAYDPEATIDMSSVIETLDLTNAIVKSGITHSGLFAMGLLAGGLGLSGEDEEDRRRRRAAKYKGFAYLYDPRDIVNDFRNADSIYLDWLPFELDEFFRVTDDENAGAHSMAGMNWIVKSILSPIIGMERFFNTGNAHELVWAYKDAFYSMPLVNTMMFDDATQVFAELSTAAADAEQQTEAGGGVANPDNLPQAFDLWTKSLMAYERMLLESSFINQLYVAADKYDRDAWVLPERGDNGQIMTNRIGIPQPTVALQDVKLDTGEVITAYKGRDWWDATLHGFTENRGTLAVLANLFTGFQGGYTRQEMTVKTRSIAKEEMGYEAAEAEVWGLWKGSKSFDSPNMEGVYIPFEMRQQIQENLMKRLVDDGIKLGLTQYKAEQRMKELWYGSSTNPTVVPLKDIVWSDKISYKQSSKYYQLNTTYVIGPDGNPWATGISRNALANLAGMAPLQRYYTGDVGLPGTDGRLNSTDDVRGINTGMRALEKVDDSWDIPSAEELANKNSGSTGQSYTPSQWQNYGRGGYGGGGGGGGGGSFTRLNPPQDSMIPYGNDIPNVNTSNPIIRRASIRRERVESQKGRLKPWQ